MCLSFTYTCLLSFFFFFLSFFSLSINVYFSSKFIKGKAKNKVDQNNRTTTERRGDGDAGGGGG